jgi:predicted  nucleic acid-binding Zn-ribbon protein
MDNTLDDQFVLVHSDNLDEIETQLESLNVQIVELEKRNKKLEEEHQNLEKRHGDLLKLMNEILKIKPSSRVDSIENLEEVRQRITQILYNEIRRHTVFSFTPILSSHTYFPILKTTSYNTNLNFQVD